MQGGAMAPAAPMGAGASATDTAAAMPAQDANYPVCKTRSQDHCRVASQMRHRKG